MKPRKSTLLSDGLHITIGIAPSAKYDLTPDLNLLKAALLYADEVKLCSLSTSALQWMQYLDQPNIIKTADKIVKFYNGEPSSERQAVQKFIDTYRSIRSRLINVQKRRNKEFRQIAENMRKEIREVIKELAGEAAIGINTALSSGIVKLEFFDIKRKSVIEDYFSVVSDAVMSGKTYPLLDNATGNLISLAIEEGKIIPLGVSVSRAKQPALSSDLFYRLPLFDKASVKEVLDIRKELRVPLTQFRAAIITFAKEVESAPWDDSFSQEVEVIYRKYVMPSILEIEDAYKSNKLLWELVTKPLETPDVYLTGLGILLDTQSTGEVLSEVVGKALLGIGILGSGVKAIKEWQERNMEMHTRPLYFYYKVQEKLS